MEEKNYFSDEEIIIPNHRIPLPKGRLESYPMDLNEFKNIIMKFNERGNYQFSNYCLMLQDNLDLKFFWHFADWTMDFVLLRCILSQQIIHALIIYYIMMVVL